MPPTSPSPVVTWLLVLDSDNTAINAAMASMAVREALIGRTMSLSECPHQLFRAFTIQNLYLDYKKCEQMGVMRSLGRFHLLAPADGSADML